MGHIIIRASHRDRWQRQRATVVQSRANGLARNTQRWFNRLRDKWLEHVLDLLQRHGPIRAVGVLESDVSNIVVSKAMTMADIEALAGEMHDLLERYGLMQINSAGKEAAQAAGGKWLIQPGIIANYAETLPNKIKLLIDGTADGVRESVQRIIAEAMRESPVPSTTEIGRRISRSWYGPQTNTRLSQLSWPGRGTAEEQRITADWARSQEQLQAGGKEYLFSFRRAHTIARTEVMRAENTGIAAGYKAANIEWVKWQAYPFNPDHDGPGKRNHYLMLKHPPITVDAMNGSDRDKWFKLPNGERAPYPGWEGLSAGNTVNCTCTIVPSRAPAGREQRR